MTVTQYFFVLMPKNPILIIYGVGVTELFSRKKLYIFADMELKTLYVV